MKQSDLTERVSLKTDVANSVSKIGRAVSQLILAYDTEIGHLQARIDALMLEYCPNEMTPEQINNWSACQQPISAEQCEAAIDSAMKEKS